VHQLPLEASNSGLLVMVQGVSPFKLDEQALAALAPGLVLTQNACATCDADAGSVAAALERAGLGGGDAQAPACVLTLAPRTLAQALDSILEASHACCTCMPCCAFSHLSTPAMGMSTGTGWLSSCEGSHRLASHAAGHALAAHIAAMVQCTLQVGHAAGVAHEAAVLVERLRARLRAAAAAVAPAQRRPRVLSLEGITPLVLGE
jgi:hypothetical protein